MRGVLERKVAGDEGFVGGEGDVVACGIVRFVIETVDFVDAQEADFGILRRLDEADELGDRGIEHADDELHGHHDAEGDFSVDDGNGAIKSDCHVLDAVDELRTDGLGCVDFKHFLIDMEEAGLEGFPFPTFLVFVVVELDFLDVLDGFHPLALVFGGKLEVFPVDFLAHAEEKENPANVEHAPNDEDKEDDFVVDAKDDAENDERDHGKDHAEGIVHDERADALVVSGALQEVADQFVLKERDGQFHEFDEVVGEQGDVHAGGGVEEHPFAEHVGEHDADEEDGVADEHHVDECDVAGLDAGVDHGFGDEGQQGLKECGNQHDTEQDAKGLFVGEEIAEEVFKSLLPFFFLLHFDLHEVCHRFEQEGSAGFFVRLVPFAGKFFVPVGEQAFGGVGDADFVRGGFVHDNEVAVVPVDDAGERDAGQEVGEGGFDGHAAQADLPGSVADVEERNALAGDAAKVAEVLQGVVFPVIFGDDFEACGTAVLGIHLKFMRKTL